MIKRTYSRRAPAPLPLLNVKTDTKLLDSTVGLDKENIGVVDNQLKGPRKAKGDVAVHESKKRSGATVRTKKRSRPLALVEEGSNGSPAKRKRLPQRSTQDRRLDKSTSDMQAFFAAKNAEFAEIGKYELIEAKDVDEKIGSQRYFLLDSLIASSSGISSCARSLVFSNSESVHIDDAVSLGGSVIDLNDDISCSGNFAGVPLASNEDFDIAYKSSPSPMLDIAGSHPEVVSPSTSRHRSRNFSGVQKREPVEQSTEATIDVANLEEKILFERLVQPIGAHTIESPSRSTIFDPSQSCPSSPTRTMPSNVDLADYIFATFVQPKPAAPSETPRRHVQHSSQ